MSDWQFWKEGYLECVLEQNTLAVERRQLYNTAICVFCPGSYQSSSDGAIQEKRECS